MLVGSNNRLLRFSNKLAGYSDSPIDPWNPLNLPPYTFRVKLDDTAYDCSNKGFTGTWTRVGTDGTWDVYYPNSNWSRLLRNSIGFWGQRKTHQILGLNTNDITNMERFEDCGQSYVYGTLPLFDTTQLTNVTNCFYECFYIDEGQLALYQQMSSQTTPPANHYGCFRQCGKNSQTGSAELAQIPSDWK